MPKSITATEHEIQQAIIDLIKARGGVVTRVNSGSAVFKRDGVTQVIKGAEKGTSDLICCYRGVYLAIEVKRAGKKATPEQIAFLESVAKAGGVGLVAYDSEFVESILNEIDTCHTHSSAICGIRHNIMQTYDNRLFVKG